MIVNFVCTFLSSYGGSENTISTRSWIWPLWRKNYCLLNLPWHIVYKKFRSFHTVSSYPFLTCNCHCYKIFLPLWIIFVILPSCYAYPKGPLCRETVENVNNSSTTIVVLLYLSNISLEKDFSVYIISRKVQCLAKKTFEKSWLFYHGNNSTRLGFFEVYWHSNRNSTSKTIRQAILENDVCIEPVLPTLNSCGELNC